MCSKTFFLLVPCSNGRLYYANTSLYKRLIDPNKQCNYISDSENIYVFHRKQENIWKWPQTFERQSTLHICTSLTIDRLQLKNYYFQL